MAIEGFQTEPKPKRVDQMSVNEKDELLRKELPQVYDLFLAGELNPRGLTEPKKQLVTAELADCIFGAKEGYSVAKRKDENGLPPEQQSIILTRLNKGFPSYAVLRALGRGIEVKALHTEEGVMHIMNIPAIESRKA